MPRLKSRKRTRRTRRKRGGGECNEATIYERMEKYGIFQKIEDFKQKLYEGFELPESLKDSINEGKISEKAKRMKEFEIHLDTEFDSGDNAAGINTWHDKAAMDGSGYTGYDRLCALPSQLTAFMKQMKMEVILGRDEKDVEGGCCKYNIASSGGRRRRRKSRRKSKKRRRKTKKRRRRRR